MADNQSGLVQKVVNAQQPKSMEHSKVVYSSERGFVDPNFEKVLSLVEKYCPKQDQNYH